MQQEMSFHTLNETLSKITYRDWTLKSFEKEDGYLLQWIFMEKDVMKPKDETLYEQYCRKWYVSKFSTETEVIRTAWLAVQQAVIHEISESFLYNNIRIFDPHTNYVELAVYMSTANQDIRE